MGSEAIADIEVIEAISDEMRIVVESPSSSTSFRQDGA
jgi:hypothetical protein